MLQHRPGVSGIGKIKRNAGTKHAVEPAFEHRRRPERPGRKLHHQRIGGHQPIGIGLIVEAIALGVVIIPTALCRKYRIEILGIEIEQIDRMTSLRKASQRLFPDSGVKTVVERMAIDIEHAHRQALALTKLRILPGLSRPNGSTSCLNPSWSASARL